MIYLATPFWHHEEAVRNSRRDAASFVAAKLMERGEVVYSPISHGHSLSHNLPSALRDNHEFWMKQDLPWLKRSQRLVILPLEGWEASRGVAEEFEFANEHSIPVHFVGLCTGPLGTLSPADVFIRHAMDFAILPWPRGLTWSF